MCRLTDRGGTGGLSFCFLSVYASMVGPDWPGGLRFPCSVDFAERMCYNYLNHLYLPDGFETCLLPASGGHKNSKSAILTSDRYP